MPSSAGVQLEGAANLRRTLRRAGVELLGLKQAHAAAGSIVTPAAKGKAPSKSGALAGSIRAGTAAASLTIRAGGASLPYAGPIHYGWKKRNIRAQPFIVEAVDEKQGAMLTAYEAGVALIVNRIKGK